MNQTDIQYAEAKDYATSKPQTTARQLRERFQSLRAEQARKLMYYARIAARKRGEKLTLVPPQQQRDDLHNLARAHANANPEMTASQLRQLFLVSEGHAHKLLREARANAPQPVVRIAATKTAAPIKPAMIAARDYAVANPTESCEQIAKRYGVAPTSLRRWRRMHQVATALAEAKQKATNPTKPPRKQRRLFAIMADGERCEARMVRNTKSIERFEMVMA